MDDMNVLILAAGKMDRWTEAYPKQLATINGVPLLERTIKQLADWHIRPTVITTNEEITTFLSDKNICNIWPPPKRRWTCETILSVSNLWGERTVILLGDVVFHDDDLADVLAYSKYIALYHNADIGEIMAIQFCRKHHSRMMTSLSLVIAEAEAGKCRGKLWEWYDIVKRAGGIRAVRLHKSMDIDTVEDWQDVNAIYSEGRQNLVQSWAGVKPYKGGDSK